MVQAVAVIVSLIFIYRQVRIQRMANSLTTLKEFRERWDSRRLSDARAAVVSAYSSRDKKIDHTEESLLNFFEEMGLNVSRGIFDACSVWETYSYYLEHYWPILLPKVTEMRAAERDGSYFEQAEKLYSKCCAISKKRGAEAAKTEEQLTRFITGELGYIKYRGEGSTKETSS